ncbi:MAG TPA: hypothetical protein VMN82_02535 [Thermoanaerobaculia bacterium]|nr:hypothetical protein [Thermoanaerobaculia bacterium]
MLFAALAAAALLTVACGKKGDPQPPLPRGPNAIKNLTVEQEGDDAVLTFAFPDRLINGAPLTDLFEIEVFRLSNPPPAITSPRPSTAGGAAPSGVSGQSSTSVAALPGAAERRAATNVRVAEEAFYGAARKVAVLSLSAISELTRGASVVYRDPLSPLIAKEGKPTPLAYAVVSVRRGGETSPLSNIVTLTPDVAPDAPTDLEAFPYEGRICLDWSPPQTDVLGRLVDVGGYEIYRRILPQDEYQAPLNPQPVAGLSYVDFGAPYGAPLVYTVRAVLAKNPKVEGLPSEELPVLYRDVYPPPAPTRLDALSEGTRVRVVWTPVDAGDLAGYLVFRAEGNGPLARLTPAPVTDPFYTDDAVAQGRRYRYVVRAIDHAGNMSEPSPEAVAEPY